MLTQETAICNLCKPAMCEYRVDGQSAGVYLCGGCKLFSEVKACPYRIIATLSYEIKETNNTKG